MAFQFFFTIKAEDDLQKLDTFERKRIFKKLAQLKNYDSLPHVATTLSGNFQSIQRIRIGQYRLLCQIAENTVTVLRIQHRREVYR